MVAQATIDLLKKVDSKQLHTITFDNGTEFSAHKYIAEELSVAVYFARPYCSNDRARNENTNGLLRQYFPKKTRFDTISEEQLQRAVQDLNNRPRKTLHYSVKPPLFGPVVMRVSVFHERASWQDCMGACGAERSEAEQAPMQSSANSFGVRLPREKWGRASL